MAQRISGLLFLRVQMGVELEEKVTKEVQDVIQYASGPWPSEMKSIRGLEERLYGLDKLVHSAETTVEAQVNTAKVCVLSLIHI